MHLPLCLLQREQRHGSDDDKIRRGIAKFRLVAFDYLELLAEVKPEKLEPTAVRWHGRLEIEAAAMTLAESQLALAALGSLCAGRA